MLLEKVNTSGVFEPKFRVERDGNVCIGASDCITSWSQAGGSSQWTTSGNDIYNNNTGNVGISRTPNHKLDVNGIVKMNDGIIISDKYFGSSNSGTNRWAKLLQFDLTSDYQHAHYSIILTSRYYSSELALEAYTTTLFVGKFFLC